MSDQFDLKRIVGTTPEHPVPHAGDVVDLTYPPLDSGVGVWLTSDAHGNARMRVTAYAAVAASCMQTAQRALIRSTGTDPEEVDALDKARGVLGAMEFANNVNVLTKRAIATLAFLRTGVMPFLAPRYPASDGPLTGRPFVFDVEFLLEPSGTLADYSQLKVRIPELGRIDERRVNDLARQLAGGRDTLDDLPVEAADVLRAKAREGVVLELENDRRTRLMELCANEVASRLVSPPPQPYVELLRNELANRFAEGIVASGRSWEQHISSPEFNMEAFKAQMTAEATASLRRGMALDAVAEREGILIDEADLFDCLAAIAKGHELEAAQGMLESGQILQFLESARRSKTSDWLASHAVDTR